jgi:hypothetical protein
MAYDFQTLNNGADPTFNQLLAINDFGTIAGYFGSGAAGHPNQGYTLVPPYGQADYTNENFPTSVQTQVTGINNFGLTSGFWVDGAGDNLGFVERNNSFTTALDPNAPPLGGATPTVEQFLGVNDWGRVAGFYNDAAGNAHGFLYSIGSGSFTAVNVADATSVTATDVNDRGQVSGFFTDAAGATQGFVQSPDGSTTTLAGPSGATDVMALGLNNIGQVVGSFVAADGNTDGFLYDMNAQSYTTVVDPNANGMTTVNGINDLGQLVGFYLDATGNTDGMLANPAGGQQMSLQDLLPSLPASVTGSGAFGNAATPNTATSPPNTAVVTPDIAAGGGGAVGMGNGNGNGAVGNGIGNGQGNGPGAALVLPSLTG